jgi:hypothetical protein
MKNILIITIIGISTYACSKKSTTPDYSTDVTCVGVTPTYSTGVSNIIDNNCAFSGCHNSASSQAGINLEGYSNASNEFKSNNKNLIAIHHGSGAEAMPKNSGKLADSIINKLDCWVKNSCPQ